MEYLYSKSFSVGGYGREYSNNWDKVFGKKGSDPEEVPADEHRGTFGDPELDALAEKACAAYAAATPEQRAAWDRAQRISFVYGNLRLDGVEVTEEQIAAAVDAADARAARTCRHARASDSPCDGDVVHDGLCRLHLDVEVQEAEDVVAELERELEAGRRALAHLGRAEHRGVDEGRAGEVARLRAALEEVITADAGVGSDDVTAKTRAILRMKQIAGEALGVDVGPRMPEPRRS